MLVYTVRRLLGTIPLLLAASLLTFLLVDLSGDPLADLKVQQPPVPAEVIEAEEERLYLDRSLPERYVLWLTGIGGDGDIGLLRGEFGPSVRGPDYDIGQALADRLGTTLRLVAAALLLALGLAILTGVVSAVRQYSAIDYTLTFVGFLALAMPTFWLGALVKEAGVWANQQTGYTLFYTVGATSADTRGFTAWQLFTDHLGHLVLPTLTLMLTGYAAWSRYQRTSMLEVLNSDYVRLARAKGLRNRVVMRRHALRTALIPIVTLMALTISGVLTGAVITETIFGWRGLGTFFVAAVGNIDAFAVLAFVLVSGVLVVFANLAADLLYAVLDPRIRRE